MKIIELPFHERPVLELLDLQHDRAEPNRDYSGYGWARVPRIYLDDLPVDDALVLAVHSADDGPALPDDIELEFELPGREPVAVLARDFLARWLPQLPRAGAIVLALCNPHAAALRMATDVPAYYATGDVTAWLEAGRIQLAADGTWARVDT